MHRADAHYLDEAPNVPDAAVELTVEVEDLGCQPEAEMVRRQHVVMPAERLKVELPGELGRAAILRRMQQQDAGLAPAMTFTRLEIVRADAVDRNVLAFAH